MMNYLDITEKYRYLLADNADIKHAVSRVCHTLSVDLSVSVAVVNSAGVLVANESTSELEPLLGVVGNPLDSVLADSFAELNTDLLAVPMNELPITTAVRSVLSEYVIYVLVLRVFDNRVGSFIVYKSALSTALNDEELSVCNLSASMLGLMMWQIQSTDKREEERKREAVRVVTESLSYSELMVLATIFDDFEDSEGIIVASRIADREGITRSVIVNAIRKLESAGIIESRSLGMKGTYIKILNKYFVSEIAKIKK